MTAAVIGKVKQVTSSGFVLCDTSTGEEITCVSSDSPEVGTEGIFVGKFYEGKLHVSKFNPQTFLDPLSEDILVTEAGLISNIELVGDPFDEVYEKLKNA